MRQKKKRIGKRSIDVGSNLKKFLATIEIFVGITAFLGGIGLILTNGSGMPTEWLDNTPFQSFLLPGLALIFLVGGTNLIAAIAILKNLKSSTYLSSMAGFSLLIFEFSQLYFLNKTHILQVFYFAVGIVILTITIFLSESKS